MRFMSDNDQMELSQKSSNFLLFLWTIRHSWCILDIFENPPIFLYIFTFSSRIFKNIGHFNNQLENLLDFLWKFYQIILSSIWTSVLCQNNWWILMFWRNNQCTFSSMIFIFRYDEVPVSWSVEIKIQCFGLRKKKHANTNGASINVPLVGIY